MEANLEDNAGLKDEGTNRVRQGGGEEAGLLC